MDEASWERVAGYPAIWNLETGFRSPASMTASESPATTSIIPTKACSPKPRRRFLKDKRQSGDDEACDAVSSIATEISQTMTSPEKSTIASSTPSRTPTPLVTSVEVPPSDPSTVDPPKIKLCHDRFTYSDDVSCSKGCVTGKCKAYSCVQCDSGPTWLCSCPK